MTSQTTKYAFLFALLTSVVAASPSWAQPAQIAGAAVQVDESRQSAELPVPAGKSRILTVDRAFSELSVGNPEIADVVPLSNHKVYVLGKKVGATNLTISTAKGQIY